MSGRSKKQGYQLNASAKVGENPDPPTPIPPLPGSIPRSNGSKATVYGYRTALEKHSKLYSGSNRKKKNISSYKVKKIK